MADQFDELAKSLAAGVSRREALRGIGATVVGIVLASLGLPAKAAPANPCCRDICRASGAKGGNCAKFCSEHVASRSYCCISQFTNGVACFGDLGNAQGNCGSNTICP